MEWMAAENSNVTNQWYCEIVDAILTLESFPARCHLAPENGCVPFELRHLLHGKRRNAYRILFTIQEDREHVLHIRHSARDWMQPEDLELP